MAQEETVKASDALPPDASQAESVAPTPKPAQPVAEEQETPEEKQSTREWLRSLGVMAADVATREQPRVEREAVRERPVVEQPPSDVDEVRSLLREGDDARFIEGIVSLSRKRIMDDMTRTERDAAFAGEINKFVSRQAPDLPLVVFWAYADRAERQFPGVVDKQIDWAIEAGRTAMRQHNAQEQDRANAIRAVQNESETLDGTPTRQRRRGAREGEGKTTTFVEELLAARSKYD